MMRLRFLIDYYTTLGQSLAIHCAVTTTERQYYHTLLLSSDDSHTWQGALEVEADVVKLSYNYAVYANGQVVREEKQGIHTLDLTCQPSSSYTIRDVWYINHLPSAYSTSALRDVVYRHKESRLDTFAQSVVFKVEALPRDGYHLAVVGSSKALGEWQPKQAYALRRLNAYEWGIVMPLSETLLACEYKYIWRADDDFDKAIWEEGDNRSLLPLHKRNVEHHTLLLSDGMLRMSYEQWRGAGMVLPLFSIRTEHTCGVGDMTSLAMLIEWCASLGMSVLQLLPINDTTDIGHWRESYPYNGVSVFALHPMYLDITAMGPLSGTIAEDYHKAQQELNALDSVDYEAVNRLKWKFIRWQYQQNKGRVCKSKAFRAFCTKQAMWLPQYAYFCYFRDLYHTADFRQWPQFAHYDAVALHQYFEKDSTAYDELLLYYYVQYELHRQLSNAKKVAQKRGVILKGDIPIGICRNSDSAWCCPELFNFNGQAGAPPDDFARDGQNWGFPTYNWPQHEATHYVWWRQRFEQLSAYFDAYRIDHVLGFFRIWEIPYGTRSGLLGQFSPALGMTEKELLNFGFELDTYKHLMPYITPQSVAEHIDSTYLDEVVTACFERTANGLYAFRTHLPNQDALLAFFETKPHWPENVRTYLLNYYTEVLFVADREQTAYVHPRILGEQTALFQTLSHEQQKAYRTLYQHYYYQRNDYLWQQEALRKLSALIESSRLLPCAEDLGMLPNGVRETLQALELLSLEIQTMPKTYGTRFADTSAYPYLSVATFATHDMPPLRNWWANNPAVAEEFYHQALGQEGEVPQEISPEIAEKVVCQHLESPSMLCLLAFQDWLAMDTKVRASDYSQEQINVPANPNHYWRYRMHAPIEKLAKNTEFTNMIRSLIKGAKR